MKRPLYTKKTRVFALFTLLTQCFALFAPQISVAQTTSETQAETSGPSGQTTQMVDLFTGDFNYSIPLMNVDGFPITLNYNGNVTMHQEASWVGLGWTLNTGAINREMRGIPDDFNGDEIKATEKIKQDYAYFGNAGLNSTYCFSPPIINPLRFGLGLELKGGPLYDNYQGNGHNFDLLFNITSGTENINGKNVAFNKSLGLNMNSLRGVSWHRSQWSASLFESKNGEPIYGFDITASNVTTTNSSRGARTKYKQSGIGGFNTSKKFGGRIGTGGDISYGSKTFIPQISKSGVGSGFMFRSEMGYFGGTPLPTLSLYAVAESGTNNHDYASQTDIKKAYGYLNLQNGANVSNAITDFNRENWDKISKETQVLPVAHITHDIFRMSTPTHSVVFRAHRNDVGCTNTYQTSENTTSHSGTVEAGVGALFRISATYGNTQISGESKNWLETGSASHYMWNKAVRNYDPENETYYFKSAGEPVKFNSTFFDQYGGTSVSAIDISRSGSDYDNLPVLNNYNDFYQSTGTSSLPSNNYISGKQPRNTLYSTLSAQLASEENVGFEEDMVSYGLNTYGSGRNETTETVERITAIKKSHHLSEITVTSPDGERSVFNYPTYSIKEKEVYFNVTGNSPVSAEENLIEYSGTDNSTSNDRGYEELFHSNEIPGYASSFLLRGILSPDYSDRTGNGMSEDDYGSYIKVNYTQLYDESNPFKWRAPIRETGSDPVASHFKNVESYTNDEIGYYSYGEKELWYTHSIEGKNYVAVFYLEDRDDMFSVTDEDGELDTGKPGKLLDRIVLFSKEDLETNGANAEAIQTIKFNYDYSLCQNFAGNQNHSAGDETSGKLTLKSVYITTSDSKKGSLTSFSFGYDNNPDYHTGKTDRWGSYDEDVTGVLNNFDFPYSNQDKTTADANSSAWALTDINLPTGGKIEITYEADNYAYVENRRAMQMLPIKNLSRNVYFSEFEDHLSSSLVKDGGTILENKRKSNNILFIDLPEDIVATTETIGKQKFYEAYLKEIIERYDKQLYFRCRVEMTEGEENYEWISGYAKIADYGVVNNSYQNSYPCNTSTAFIMLEDIDVDFGDNNNSEYGVNPIMHKSWQDLRLNMNRILYPDGNPSVNGLDWNVMLNGINKALNNKEFCRNIDLNESFVRLINPGKNKIGGGSRVQKIIYKDGWNSMTGENDFFYGETYEYLTEDGTSSGVASYEPTTGNDENPFRQPIRYYLDHDKYPTDLFYHQTPFGEMAFQAPGVGYSRIKVKNIERTDVTTNATGFRLYEFFTAKDFPTRNVKSPIEIKPLETQPNLLSALVGLPQFDLVGLSQGFVTQKNDMHGKTKSVKSFNEAGSEISSTEYSYKVGEEMNLVEKETNVTSSVLGRDMDMVADAFTTVVKTTQFNVGGFASITGVTPLVIPSAGPIASLSQKEEGFFMTTFNKVIHDYAILDKVTTRHLGAQTIAQNLAYDEKTGQVLVSSVQNQYDKPVYSVSYPTWWYNEFFEPASSNYATHEEGINISSGVFTTTDGSIYHEGDIVYVKSGANYFKYTVFLINNTPTPDQITLIDDDGTLAANATGADIVIIKPAKKNIPFMTMMEYTSLENPIPGGTLDPPTDVLSASAVEYSECWQVYSNNTVNCSETEPTCGLYTGVEFNPFHVGIRGNWRVKKGYVFQENRDEESTGSSIDMRTAGTYKTFEPAFEFDSPNWIDIFNPAHSGYANRAKWINTGEIRRYDDNGNPIETVDILGNYSSVLFGYNQNLKVAPIAAATNARLTQCAFDGFEDYIYRDDIFSGGFCRLPGHFDFIEDGGATAVRSNEAHSGKYSLKLEQGETISVSRKANSEEEDYPVSCGRITKLDFENSNQLPVFNPNNNSDKPYVISVWVKQDFAADNPVNAYTDPKIAVLQSIGGSTIQTDYFICDEDSPIIEGWQKITGTFIVDSDADCISISLLHGAEFEEDVYFDDLRIHPFNSSMGTISYDPLTLRKLSQGDDYNFTTFFQYDENGFMSRVLQETIKGLVTLTETRSGLKK